MQDDDAEQKTDPTGRFERYDHCLGKGAYKEVYKAFDQEEGVEVAWNQLRIDHIPKRDIPRVLGEIRILESLRNDNIINLSYSWVAKGEDGKEKVYFITELMTSGTLKGYCRRTKGDIKPKILKNWCRQILSGLDYLHSRNPPIIHRDLKCENIFINGNNGQAKIGDLGLAVVKHTEHLSSVLGTPEFLAPEVYDEKYDEKVDIYAFGMVVLEIVTREYPYNECTNQAQIYKKVSSGIKPSSLSKVTDEATRSFIETCITFDPKMRPSARKLLEHPFLSIVEQLPSKDSSLSSELYVASLSTDGKPSTQIPGPTLINKTQATVVDAENHTFHILERPANNATAATETNCIVEVVGRPSQDEVTLRMVYGILGGTASEIRFPFKLTEDTATDVVQEMIKESIIASQDEQLARRKLEEAIRMILLGQIRNNSNSEVKAIYNYSPQPSPEIRPQNSLQTSDPVHPLQLPGSLSLESIKSADSNSTQSSQGNFTPSTGRSSVTTDGSSVRVKLRELEELNLRGLNSLNLKLNSGQSQKSNNKGNSQDGEKPWPVTWNTDQKIPQSPNSLLQRVQTYPTSTTSNIPLSSVETSKTLPRSQASFGNQANDVTGNNDLPSL